MSKKKKRRKRINEPKTKAQSSVQHTAQVEKVTPMLPQPEGLHLPMLLFIFLLAFTIRAIFIHQQSEHNPVFYYPAMDEAYHDQWAQTLIQGKTFQPGQPYFRAPLYPISLAIFYQLLGRDLYWIRMCQAALGALSCVLIFLLARSFCSLKSSIMAAVLSALYAPLIYFDAQLLITGVAVFLNVMLLIFLLQARVGRHTFLLWFLAGLVCGLSAITRPNILIFFPVVIVYAFTVRHADHKRLPQKWQHILLFLAGMLVIIAPVTIRNYVESHDFVPISSQGGVNFYIGNNPRADGKTAIVPGTRADWWGGYEDSRNIAFKALGETAKDSQISRFWYGEALKFITTEPKQWSKLMVRKILYLVGSHEISNNSTIPFMAQYASIYRWLPINFMILAPFGLLGLGLLCGKRDYRLILPCYFLTYSLSIVLFFVTARYRIPLIPALAIGCGYCLDLFYSWWKNNQYKTILIVCLALSALFGLVNHPGQPRYDFAQAHFDLGVSYAYRGDSTSAILEYIKALNMNSSWDSPAYNLAIIYEEKNDVDQARRFYQEALMRNMKNWRAAHRWSKLELQDQNVSKALDLVDLAIQADPEEAQNHYLRGHCLMALARYEEAETSFQSCLDYDATFTNCLIYQAVSLLEQHKDATAKKLLQDILNTDPDNELALRFMKLLQIDIPDK
ncbi:glycosyltransferase family 39 protein [candidate division CSSED10-310 bacterium]|uniref:Glycosyltransferase family 39 protein n=1 Tax=candidate division CSSED10-310 bacterium TaxID=2855610 RepID=A0ABV6Z0B0_UNCC1